MKNILLMLSIVVLILLIWVGLVIWIKSTDPSSTESKSVDIQNRLAKYCDSTPIFYGIVGRVPPEGLEWMDEQNGIIIKKWRDMQSRCKSVGYATADDDFNGVVIGVKPLPGGPFGE